MTFFLSHTHTHTHTHGQKDTPYQRSIQACLILFFVGFLKLIFIGLYLLPIHISPLFWISFPFRSPTALSISVLYRKFSLAIYCIHSVNSGYMSILISLLIPAPHSLGVHTFVLCVCVSTSALQIKSCLLSLHFTLSRFPYKWKV